MTLQTIIDNIDAQYPVAGKDNDSQGFRDNFSYIKDSLTTAAGDLTSLQTKTLLTENLVNGDPIDNDLNGSSINNGFYNNFYGVSHNANANSTYNLDVTAGSIQQLTLGSTTSFTFRNWPATGKYGLVRVHFVGNGVNTWTATLFTEGGGDVVLENGFPSPLTVGTDGKHKVIEAWTYNSGATVYVRYLGEF